MVAAFLTVWLAIWALGEGVVLWILARGSRALITGTPPAPGWDALQPAPALALGTFLLLWLVFWTLGGVIAVREVLRLLCGWDRLVLTAEEIRIEHGLGLIRLRQRIPRAEVIRFHLWPSRAVLSADTVKGVIDVSRSGTDTDLEAVAAELNREWGLTPEAGEAGALPAGWIELVSPEGDTIVVYNPFRRRRQARIVAGVAAGLAFMSGLLGYASLADASLLALTALVATAAILAGWAARSLASVRDEWAVGGGWLRQQRRRHNSLQKGFEAAALAVGEQKDSEGDSTYVLTALARPETTARKAATVRVSGRALLSRAGDPTEVLEFGRWLARASGLPLYDDTTAAVKERELAELRRQLAASGRLGAWLAQRSGKSGNGPR